MSAAGSHNRVEVMHGVNLDQLMMYAVCYVDVAADHSQI